MRSKLKLNALFVFGILFGVLACQPPKKEEKETTDAEEVVEETTMVEDVVAEPSALINPNLAAAEDIISAGISEEIANQIIESRPFLSMADLDNTLSSSLDSAQKAVIYGAMFVPFNLNTTPEDDFKIIPGVGDRMAHEFEEYRPYVNIAQFRKEIGKYVDENEVTRLEKYVFVPVELNTASKEEILAIPGVGDRMLHEFEEYRPYKSMDQFRKEIGKYVDEKELARLERFVYLKSE
ncbi:MAG: hypothetical protein AAFN93_09445 [Bacteroidota bacterium]